MFDQAKGLIEQVQKQVRHRLHKLGDAAESMGMSAQLVSWLRGGADQPAPERPPRWGSLDPTVRPPPAREVSRPEAEIAPRTGDRSERVRSEIAAAKRVRELQRERRARREAEKTGSTD